MPAALRPLLAALLGAFASLALASCGGEDAKQPPSPEDAVRRTATTLITTDNTTLTCTKLLTARLVRAIYGGQSKCRSSPPSLGDQQGGSTTVGAVAITGPTARVQVVSRYGGERAGGHLTFVRQGGLWKADRLENDYLRSSLSLAVRSAKTGALSSPALRSCLARKVGSLPAAIVRTYLYESIRKDPGMHDATIGLAMRCPAPLAKFVAHQLMRAVKRSGKSAAELRCIERSTAGFLVFLTILLRAALKEHPNGAESAAIAGVVKGSIKACHARAR